MYMSNDSASPADAHAHGRPGAGTSGRGPGAGEPLVVIEPARSAFSLNLREIWTHRELLYFLVWRDLKVRYKQTALGVIWVVAQPLLTTLIFTVFLGVLARVPSDGLPYPVFVYAGLLPWTFFSGAVINSSLSLVMNGNLISKVYFPRVLIPTATVGAGLVDLAVASVILVALAFYYGMPATRNLLMLPALAALTVLLSLGLGMWLAALTVRYRDVRHVLPFTLQVWFFATPIIYPASLIHEDWRWLLFFNPMTGIVEGLRSAITGRAFDWPSIAFSAAVTLVVLVISVFTFNRFEKSFADLI